MQEVPLDAGLILCCMRGDQNHKENIETIRVAKKYLGYGVCAVDLAGAEALFPTGSFSEEFKKIREEGIPFTIHAGEADGPDSVRQALDFGATRIGHGVRSLEDEALVRRLAQEGTTLELCPTSNLNTAIFESMDHNPLRQYLDAGVNVTINTDNTSVSNTSIQNEFQKLEETFALSEMEIKDLLMNAAEASFTDEDTKKTLKDQIQAFFTLE